MISISDDIKRRFAEDGSKKELVIEFPTGEHRTLGNDDIVAESLRFTESVCSGKELKFGFCESNILEFECVGIQNIKGAKISAKIGVQKEDETPIGIDEYIPLGLFYVDSCDRTADMQRRRVIAYSWQAYTDWTGDRYLKEILSYGWCYSTSFEVPINFMQELAFPTPDWEFDTEAPAGWIDDQGIVHEHIGKASERLSPINYFRRETVVSVDDNAGFTLFVYYADYSVRAFNTAYDRINYDSEIAINDYYYRSDDTYIRSIWESLEIMREAALNPEGVSKHILDAKIKVFIPFSFCQYTSTTSTVNLGLALTDEIPYEDRKRIAASYHLGRFDEWSFGPGENSRAVMYNRSHSVKADGSGSEWAYIEGKAEISVPQAWEIKDKDGLATLASFAGNPVLFRHVYSMEYAATKNTGSVLTFSLSKKTTRKVWRSADTTVKRTEYALPDGPPEYDFQKLIESDLELFGRFGGLDRYGCFKTISLETPGSLYPANDIIPNMIVTESDGSTHWLVPKGTALSLYPSEYMSVWYDDTYTVQYGGISCTYQDEDGNEETYYYTPDGLVEGRAYQYYDISENYFVTSGMLSEDEIKEKCAELYELIKGITFMPADIRMLGMPHMEAGDVIQVRTRDGSFYTAVLRRTLKGIQSLRDSVTSK